MNQSTNFDEIYRQHSNAIFRVCLRAVSRREVAEELSSEVFLALHQSWETLTEDQMPAWLFTVAKRRAADYWRHHYVQERWLLDQHEDIRWAEPEFKLEVLLARCPNLKPIHRICTTLRFAHGMSRAEIAETTRLTELQVKGHLQYALQLLRQQMISPNTPEPTGERPSAMHNLHQPDFDQTEQEFHSKTAPAAPCPPLNLLLAAGQEVLPPEVEQQVTAHIQTCGLCQMLIKDFAGLPEANLTVLESADIRALVPRSQHPTGADRSHNFRPAFAIAAMVLFAVCGFAVYRFLRQPSPLIARPPLVAVVEAPKRLTPFEKLVPPEMALGMGSRGAHHQTTPSADALMPAFTAYNAGNYATAKTAFSALAQQYPKSDLPLLYLGVTDLLLDKNHEAADALSRAETLAGPTRKEPIAWYRALAAQRTDDPSAITRFTAICTNGGTYSAPACAVTK